MEEWLRQRYLDLVESCLLNLIYEDPWTDWSERVQPRAFDLERRRLGRDWPMKAHTMIGQLRMRNIRSLVEAALRDNVPGDLIETGVWRGGACIYMRAILAAHGVQDRRVFVADSFAGLPPPNPQKYPADSGDKHHQFTELAVSLDEVQDNFSRYGLLDEQVVFLKGWFKDTLPTAPIEQLAVIRLDGDMYESTIDSLSNLYHKLSPGGYAIIDDYGCIASCRKAVDEFRTAHGITAPLVSIDNWGVYWQKPLAAEKRLSAQAIPPTEAPSLPAFPGQRRINIAQIVINEHGPIFSDLIALLTNAFSHLHVDVTTTVNQLYNDRLNLIVGATCFLSDETLTSVMSSGYPYIVFQMEALTDGDGFLLRYPRYLEFLRSASHVWDYNESNVKYLVENGCPRVSYIPIGYSAPLERIPLCRADDREIDVLFYGAMSERRICLLQSMQNSGLKVEPLFGVYGPERDQRIARAKIVLNLHQFAASQLEQVRVSFLLNNRCFVISEASDCNPYGGGVVFAPYDGLVDCCQKYLATGMEAERERVSQLGYTALKAIPMLDKLGVALDRCFSSPAIGT